MDKTISKLLKKIRKSKKLTQTELGTRIGISRSKISSWEVGRRDMSVDDVITLCNYYDESIDCIFNSQKLNSKKVLDVFEKYVENNELTDEERKELLERVEEILQL